MASAVLKTKNQTSSRSKITINHMNGGRLSGGQPLLGLRGNLSLGPPRPGKVGLGPGSGPMGSKRGLSGGNWPGVCPGPGMSELMGSPTKGSVTLSSYSPPIIPGGRRELGGKGLGCQGLGPSGMGWGNGGGNNTWRPLWASLLCLYLFL